jgi:hypothetical protein
MLGAMLSALREPREEDEEGTLNDKASGQRHAMLKPRFERDAMRSPRKS